MKKINKQKGYTIIETMISISLFVIIVMAGMGALLNANLLHGKSQKMRSIMDSLNFVMEDMSKNLRTGYNYHCIVAGGSLSDVLPLSCPFGVGISFKISPSNSQWIYYIDRNLNDINKYSIFKKVDTSVAVQLTPDEIDINPVSGFLVLGAEPPEYNIDGTMDISSNQQQPFVTIRLVGNIDHKGSMTPFNLQTSVSQRAIDI